MQNLTDSYFMTHALEIRLAIGAAGLLGAYAIIKGSQYLAAAYKAYVSKVEAMRSTTGRLSTSNVR
jgi:hypothetical protein